ncbi:MAG: hypothetical protein AYW82_03685 [Bifidobacterium dentium]|nr:MAG: hypothetical protein AYW82_03685 [Bifidobacterium dentium]
MRRTVIITVKIRDSFYRLIENGLKQYEVRTEPFGDAQAIVFVDAETGARLGIRRILGTKRYGRGEDEQVLGLSGIGQSDFRKLFPSKRDGGPAFLWVARLGRSVSPDDLLEGRE